MKTRPIAEAQQTMRGAAAFHPIPRRHDRLPHNPVNDPYKLLEKIPEPAVCPQCKAVFRKGNWHWLDSWPYEAKEHLCQACRRIRDNYPAGLISLHGGFVEKHGAELMNLARRLEQREQSEHPLHRIMGIEEKRGDITIKTTDVHLPHCIGHALHDDYAGELKIQYRPEEYFARVTWRRDV